MSLVVRAGAPADAEAIAALSVRAWHHAYADILDAVALAERDVERQAARWRALLAEPERETWVAQAGGRIVAYATIRPSGEADATPAVGALEGLEVDPAAQGSGLGARMHERALAGLRERGFGHATAWVFAADDRGRAFSEHRGWRPDPEDPGDGGHGWPAPSVRYRREL